MSPTAIYKKKDWSILLNPQTLENHGPNARGVILESGDLFLENISNGSIHNDILKILHEIKILQGAFRKDWTGKLPQETGFLTVQRYNDSALIAIGESNKLLYTLESYTNQIRHYDEFLERAAQKNPGIRFINKLVRVKAPFREDSPLVRVWESDLPEFIKH